MHKWKVSLADCIEYVERDIEVTHYQIKNKSEPLKWRNYMRNLWSYDCDLIKLLYGKKPKRSITNIVRFYMYAHNGHPTELAALALYCDIPRRQKFRILKWFMSKCDYYPILEPFLGMKELPKHFHDKLTSHVICLKLKN